MTVKVTKPAVNLREELADLRKPTGIAGEAMLRAETPQEQFQLIGAGRRNLIINGDCNISQRGDFTTASSASDETYYLDRFEQNLGTVTANKQHITSNQPSALSNTKSWKLTATSTANGFMGTRQTIEDYKLFNGREFTVSAWVKTNHPSVRFYLFHGSNTDQGKNTAIADGEWHYLQETFTFDATVGTQFSVEVIILSAAGSNTSITSGDYVEFTGLQVELGKVATPFEHRSYGEELALCQRYYWRSASAAYTYLGTGLITNASLGLVPIFFPQKMRATPTCSASGSFGLLQTSTLSASLAFSEGSQQSIRANVTVSGATAGRACLLRTENSTAAYIDADAEL
jgi:hypothetical protein